MIYYVIFLSHHVNKLRCAVIGCGRIGCGFDDISDGTVKTHAGSYYKNSKTELVALCDIDQKKLKKYGLKFNVTGLYNQNSEMFKKEKVDCVSICTLVDNHFDIVKEAVKFNVKGIFIEKPISSSLQQAKRIIEICKKNNVTLVVDYQRRFVPFYAKIQMLIKQKRMGNIQKINVYYGSGIANTGSHLFDILRMFFGEVKSIQANYSNNISNNLQDPNIDAKIEFFNKNKCTIQAVDFKNFALFEMDIIGTLGRMKLDLISNEAEFYKIDKNNSLVYKKLIPSRLLIKKSRYSPIELGVKNLVESTLKKKNSMSTGIDGYKSLELIIAAITSAKTGKKITLPISNNNYKISSK